MNLRPWLSLPILDCGEPLVELPLHLHRLEPHPYLSLGAPYGELACPWRVREGLIARLSSAQDVLQTSFPDLLIGIFDAWRPITVQSFMVEHAINEQCFLKGIKRNNDRNSAQMKEVIDEVERFWAPPSLNPSMPPPHSTGAAVDLTLIDKDFQLLDMGGEIDQIGVVSEPNYFLELAKTNSEYRVFNERRMTLKSVMTDQGFVQHPNEWWHFSFGDQLWAWKNNIPEAIYGACSPSFSSFKTA